VKLHPLLNDPRAVLIARTHPADPPQWADFRHAAHNILDAMQFEIEGEKIVIKPNVTVGERFADPNTGITTHPGFVQGILEYANDHGAARNRTFILEDPDQCCNILEEAVNPAFEGRPGPVHIHIPKDITVAEVKKFRQINLDIKPVLPVHGEAEQFAGVLADAISHNRQVVLLIGYGAIRSKAEGELLNFIERFQIPFMTTMDAKGILPENHPLSLRKTSRDDAERFDEAVLPFRDLILPRKVFWSIAYSV
jgi:hypothetical protein